MRRAANTRRMPDKKDQPALVVTMIPVVLILLEHHTLIVISN